MNKINLSNLQLKTFTEQDASDYCLLNNINRHVITELDLSGNKLTDITGIKLFKNLETLYLYNNETADISVLKDLNKLKTLNISYNQIIDISPIKYLKNLEILCLHNNKIKDISYLKNLKKLRYLSIQNLNLESDQIKYINSLKNLKYLYYGNGFKDINILSQLNNNIKLRQ